MNKNIVNIKDNKLKEKVNCKLKIYIESYTGDNNFTNYLNLQTSQCR